MKLYSNRFPPSPRRARMHCAEQGIALEVLDLDVDLASRRDFGDACLAVKPLGERPTLR